MRRLIMLVAALALAGAPLEGQDPQARQEQLQQQIVMRFMENLRVQTAMTDQQFQRFQDVTRRSFEARGVLERRERELWRGLEGQMRPGVAANADSVARLLDGLTQLAGERAAQLRQDQQVYAEFLTPVQRAQVTMGFRRLQNLVEQRMRQRDMPPARRRPPEL